jgi:hypothetical protein
MEVLAGWVIGLSVALTGVALGTLMGTLIGGRWVALVLGLVSAAFAVPLGRAVAQGRPYVGRLGVWRCALDATWSSLNTWAGAIYYGLHRLNGNPHDLTKTAGRGSIWLTKGVVPKYATTIGIVKAGSSERIDNHEQVHVFQARLFGPFYLPLVGLNYVVATILPYWLLFKDREKYPVTDFRSYFENGVYPHVWNELWAYRVTDTGR